MSLSTSCSSCLLFISVSQLFSSLSALFQHFSLSLISPVSQLYSSHPFLFCLHDPHVFSCLTTISLRPPYAFTSHQVRGHINSPSEIPVHLVLEFLFKIRLRSEEITFQCHTIDLFLHATQQLAWPFLRYRGDKQMWKKMHIRQNIIILNQNH